MFNSRARYLKNIYNLVSKISLVILSLVFSNNIYNLVSKIFLVILSLVFSILYIFNILGIINIIPDYLYIDKNNHWTVLLTNTLFFGLISGIIPFVL